MQNNTFSIMRPTLAQELCNNGIQPISVNNSIVYSGRKVFVFERTPETAAVILAYYNDIGKPLPHPVQRYLDQIGNGCK